MVSLGSSLWFQFVNCLPHPPGIVPFHAQVAGHLFEPGTKIIGILQDRKDDSIIYKSFGKPACGIRETQFYNMSLEEDDDCQIQRQYNHKDTDPDRKEVLSELRSFIPRFYGQCRLNFNECEVSWFFCGCFVCFMWLTWTLCVNGFRPEAKLVDISRLVDHITSPLNEWPIRRVRRSTKVHDFELNDYFSPANDANMSRISIGIVCIFRRLNSNLLLKAITLRSHLLAPLLWLWRSHVNGMEIGSTSILDYSFLIAYRSAFALWIIFVTGWLGWDWLMLLQAVCGWFATVY